MNELEKVKNEIFVGDSTIDRFVESKELNIAHFKDSFHCLLQKVPALSRCNQDKLRVILKDCASLGLMPDGKQCTIVPFGGEPTLVPTYRGLLDILYRIGFIISVTNNIHYEGDDFEYISTMEGDTITHKRNFKSDNIVGFYSRIVSKDKQVFLEYMTKKEVMKIQNKVKNKYIWNEHFGEMGKKTVFKRLCKSLPLGNFDFSQLEQAIDFDNEAYKKSVKDVTPSTFEAEEEEEVIIDKEEFKERCREIARKGYKELSIFWKDGVSDEERKLLKELGTDFVEELKVITQEVDKSKPPS